MAQKEFLNKEQDIHNYLWQTSRIYKLLSKDAAEKLLILEAMNSGIENLRTENDKFVEEIQKQFNVLTGISRQGFFSKLFSKSQIRSDSESAESKFKVLSSSLVKYLSDLVNMLISLNNTVSSKIKRQKMLLLQDIQISASEEEAIAQIKGMPLFQSLNPAEQKLLDELVWTQKKEIDSIVSALNYYIKSLADQEKLTENFAARILNYQQECDAILNLISSTPLNSLSQSELETVIFKLEHSVQDINDKTYDFWRSSHSTFESVGRAGKKFFGVQPKNSSDTFIDRFDEHLAWERSAYDFLASATNKLIDEAKRALSEKEEIKTYFNKNDLEELQILVSTEFKKEKRKLDRIKQLLAEKRDIANKLNVNQFIAVHVTDTFPLNGILKPGAAFNQRGRNTLHFTLNNAVTAHEMGSWIKKRFAVLVPLERIIDYLINLNPADTFMLGELVLPPGSEILVLAAQTDKNIPIIKSNIQLVKDIDFLRQHAGNAELRIYDPVRYETISNAVYERITQRGYRFQPYYKWDFSNVKLADKFGALANELGVSQEPHTFTDWPYFDEVIVTVAQSLKEKFDFKRCQFIKKTIETMLPKFEAETEKLVLPEDKAARDRIMTLLKKVYSDLSRQCPSKQQVA